MGFNPIPAVPLRSKPVEPYRERVITHLQDEYVHGAITLEELDARIGEALAGDPTLVTLVEPMKGKQPFDPANHPEWWQIHKGEWVPVRTIG